MQERFHEQPVRAHPYMPMIPYWLRPRPQSGPDTGISEVTNDKHKFQVNLDVSHFKPEEIQVSWQPPVLLDQYPVRPVRPIEDLVSRSASVQFLKISNCYTGIVALVQKNVLRQILDQERRSVPHTGDELDLRTFKAVHSTLILFQFDPSCLIHVHFDPNWNHWSTLIQMEYLLKLYW